MADTIPHAADELGDEEFASLRRRRRKMEEAEMDITPMIDIVFLLLIFFIVASKVDPGATASLPPAHYGEAVAGVKAVVLVVQRGESGAVRVVGENGESITTGGEEDEAEAIARYVLNGLNGGAGLGGHKDTVLIKADKDLKQGDVSKVIEAISLVKQDYESLEVLNLAILETK